MQVRRVDSHDVPKGIGDLGAASFIHREYPVTVEGFSKKMISTLQ